MPLPHCDSIQWAYGENVCASDSLTDAETRWDGKTGGHYRMPYHPRFQATRPQIATGSPSVLQVRYQPPTLPRRLHWVHLGAGEKAF